MSIPCKTGERSVTNSRRKWRKTVAPWAQALTVNAGKVSRGCRSVVRGAGTTFASTLKDVFGAIFGTNRGDAGVASRAPGTEGLGREGTVAGGSPTAALGTRSSSSRSDLETAAASVTSEHLARKNLMSYHVYLVPKTQHQWHLLCREEHIYRRARSSFTTATRENGNKIRGYKSPPK